MKTKLIAVVLLASVVNPCFARGGGDGDGGGGPKIGKGVFRVLSGDGSGGGGPKLINNLGQEITDLELINPVEVVTKKNVYLLNNLNNEELEIYIDEKFKNEEVIDVLFF